MPHPIITSRWTRIAGLAIASFTTQVVASAAALPPPVDGYPIGWCTRVRPEALADAKSSAFEFLELALQDVLNLPADEFTEAVERVRASGRPALTGYNPLPGELKIVGAGTDVAREDAHLERLLARAQALQLRYVIFNSGRNWNVPDGFSREAAFAQLTNFARRFATRAEAHGITVLVEPMRDRDSNMITTITQALALVRAVDHPAFAMMVDYSFLTIQQDDLNALLAAGRHLRHVHIANPVKNRTYPMADDGADYAPFFAVLRQIGYRGGISVHAGTSAFAEDAPRAITFLRGEAVKLAAPRGSVVRISEDSAVRSDQRPIPIGFHAPEVQRTFVSWMGANSTAIVKALDHATGTWSDDRVVGVSPFVDKHNYPGLLRGPDDRLYVFYGCHNSTLRLAVSPGPLSIDGTWQDGFIDVAERASYPAPVLTPDGVFYVFYRDTRKTNDYSDDRPYQYVRSADGGRTWTRHMAVDPFPRTTDNMCEVYNGKVTCQPGDATGTRGTRIHLAWTIAGEKTGRHAHATYGRNVYYAYLDPATDHFHNITGTDLGPDIDNRESDAHCLVLDTGIPERGHFAGLQVSVHYRDNGWPVIHFDDRLAGGLSSATWDGQAWVRTLIARGSRDPREIEKIGPDAFRVYRPNGTTIETFTTADAGLSWQQETTIDVGARVDRCLVVTDFHPDAKLLITEAGDDTVTKGTRDVFIGAETNVAP